MSWRKRRARPKLAKFDRSNERHRRPPALPDCEAAFRPGIQLPRCTAPIGPRKSIFAGESNMPSICACRGAQFGVREDQDRFGGVKCVGQGTTINRAGFVPGRSWLQRAEMSELRDSIYHSQLARKARQLASAHSDPIVARHLRETAIMHDRRARKRARIEAAAKGPKRGLRRLFWFL